MKGKSQQRPKRTGIFAYCSESLKKRIKRAALEKDENISEYIIKATMSRMEADASELERKKKRGQ